MESHGPTDGPLRHSIKPNREIVPEDAPKKPDLASMARPIGEDEVRTNIEVPDDPRNINPATGRVFFIPVDPLEREQESSEFASFVRTEPAEQSHGFWTASRKRGAVIVAFTSLVVGGGAIAIAQPWRSSETSVTTTVDEEEPVVTDNEVGDLPESNGFDAPLPASEYPDIVNPNHPLSAESLAAVADNPETMKQLIQITAAEAPTPEAAAHALVEERLTAIYNTSLASEYADPKYLYQYDFFAADMALKYGQPLFTGLYGNPPDSTTSLQQAYVRHATTYQILSGSTDKEEYVTSLEIVDGTLITTDNQNGTYDMQFTERRRDNFDMYDLTGDPRFTPLDGLTDYVITGAYIDSTGVWRFPRISTSESFR